MSTLAAGLSWIDLRFRGRAQAIAAAVVQSAGGVAVVDPGPTSCLETLESNLQAHGITFRDVTHLMLTHIHLDHAGACGTILRRHPHVKVLVHERGARHLIDPSRLLESATRLYGDRMDELWGEFLAVPAGSVVALAGGEQIEVGGRTFEVAYTPGHASHHVSFFDRASGVAFIGDTGGVAIDGGYVLPPTPPPDIDVELWQGSVERIEAWSPSTLFLTHFGPAPSVGPHLHALLANLATLSGLVKESLTQPGTDEEKATWFGARMRNELRRQMSDAQFSAYRLAAPVETLWLGLARYWRKKDGRP